MRYIFGPVPSRRLGRSLGIDLLPHKTCTFDCVYCECGATTERTCERREFYPLDEILVELEERLGGMRGRPDFLTLSGAGEPTLYSRCGELITEAKRLSGVPVAVITNSSLLDREEVREELLGADAVLPSLDTVLERTFRRINRPHESCSLERIIGGLERFTAEFTGRVLLEILLVDGYNADEENLEALRKTIGRLRVDSVQLNTAVRPGTVRGIGPLGADALERARALFGPRCEIIADASAAAESEELAVRERIVSLLARRPCTAVDIHRSLGVPLPGVTKLLDGLVGEGMIERVMQGERIFYVATERARRDR